MATRLSVRIRLIALMVVGLAGVSAAQQPGAKIAPRDILSVVVFGEPTLTSKFIVDADGTFDYPYIGRVKAIGLTAREVAAELKARLAPDYLLNPQVTVELEQSSSQHVNIVGEVRSPGNYPFAGQIRLLEALAKAGSLSESAADEAFLYHANAGADPSVPGAPPAQRDGIRVDLHEILSGGSDKYNILLLDGDTLVVPKVQPVFILGYVRSPGAYQAPRGATVQQALALAGGVSEKGKESGITIDRVVNGKKTTIKVANNKTEVVKPGDTIHVPPRFF